MASGLGGRIMKLALKIANWLFKPLGLVLTPGKNLLLTYQHDYGKGSYDEYRRMQIFHNKRKIEKVWADAETITFIASYLRAHVGQVERGICHGTRRGYEQAEFSRQLQCPVVGTEISDTAKDFPDTVEWDFHDPRPDWIGAFTFVYTNSLDQAFSPRKALDTWVEQLKPEGYLFVEHTMQHSALGASEMDPFGAHPMVMPYLLFEWGKGRYELHDILRPPHKKPGNLDLWIFVIRKRLEKSGRMGISP
jgi:hypothetical protein